MFDAHCQTAWAAIARWSGVVHGLVGQRGHLHVEQGHVDMLSQAAAFRARQTACTALRPRTGPVRMSVSTTPTPGGRRPLSSSGRPVMS